MSRDKAMSLKYLRIIPLKKRNDARPYITPLAPICHASLPAIQTSNPVRKYVQIKTFNATSE
jgi:hypothetical protein